MTAGEGSDPYLPVPHWSLQGGWEPVHEQTGARLPWPAGFDPAVLPRPRCRLRERVIFLWKGRRLRGEVRDIRLGGGPYAPGQDLAALIEACYLRQTPEYTIYTGGHGYWVTEDKIL